MLLVSSWQEGTVTGNLVQVGSSVQAMATWQREETLPGEGEEKHYLLIWKFESDPSFFIALSWSFNFILNLLKVGSTKFLDQLRLISRIATNLAMAAPFRDFQPLDTYVSKIIYL